MKITEAEVAHVADLARLEVSAGDIGKFATQIDDILNYVDTLNQVDTTGVAPTSHAIDLTNAFREDVPGEHLAPEEALGNAPRKEDSSFLVPKVIE